MLNRLTNASHLAITLAAVLVLLPVSQALAAPSFPELTGRVVDQAGLLDGKARASLTRQLARHEFETNNQVVVVTVTSLYGLDIADYGRRLGNHWAIGQADRDNGVLLIVAPKERKVRIAVGRGLEGTLTNRLATSIIAAEILPAFKRDDYPAGIARGTEAILAAIAGTYKAREASIKNNESMLVLAVLGALFAVVFVMIGIMRRAGHGTDERGQDTHHSTHGSGGGYSGGGYSGGGGSFGGGGGSGSW